MPRRRAFLVGVRQRPPHRFDRDRRRRTGAYSPFDHGRSRTRASGSASLALGWPVGCTARFEVSGARKLPSRPAWICKLSRSERETLKAVYRLTKGDDAAHTGDLADRLEVSPVAR